MSANNKHNGFTLIELIIALALLSVVMVLSASGFKFGSRVWERVESQSVHIDTLQAVQGFLRTSLSHSLVRDRLQEDNFNDASESASLLENLFSGGRQHLFYVSYSPQYGVDDYLYQYQLYLDEQTNSLAINYSPYNIKLASSDKKPLSIIEGVASLEIKYFSGFHTQDDNSSWQDRWDDIYSLPLLVKINVTFIDRSKKWPELIIPMRHGPYVLR